MLQGLVGDVDATEHACDLVNPRFRVELIDPGLGRPAVAQLVHAALVVGLGGHLRQMGDAQDLSLVAQASQQMIDQARDSRIRLPNRGLRLPLSAA